MLGSDWVDVRARDRSLEVDQAIFILCYWMLENMSRLISNNSVYGLCEEWSKLETFRYQREILAFMAAMMQRSFMRLSTSSDCDLHSSAVIEVDENASVVMRIASKAGLIFLDRNRSGRFCTAERSKLKLDMKQSTPSIDSTMYFRGILNMKNSTKTFLEIGAMPNDLEMT